MSAVVAHESIQKTVKALQENNLQVQVLPDGAAALETIKSLIPAGASVMNGASRTLEQIGFVEYLKSAEHPWNNYHATILAESDPAKQARMRKEFTVSDFYLGSVHAVTEEGELIIATNSGSQIPGIVFNADNIIFVVGTQKIVPDLSAGLQRLEEVVIPQEDERMKQVYGFGTLLSKILIFKKENPGMGRNVHLLLVEETLGF